MKKIVDINTIIHNAALEGGIFNIKPLNTIWPLHTCQVKTKEIFVIY